MCLNKCVPKKFFWYISLERGLIGFAIILSISMMSCAITFSLEVVDYLDCERNSHGYVLRRSCSFSIMSVIYSILMLCVHLWFIWGIRNKKSSVVQLWVLIFGIWTFQVFIVIFVELMLNIKDTKFIMWLFNLIFGTLTFVILSYGLLAGYGYWIQLKNTIESSETAMPE